MKNKLLKAAALGSLSLAAVLIHYFEGVKYEPYYDVAGVLTVCYGHTGNDIDKDKRYSQDECDALLDTDLSGYRNRLDALLKKPLPDTTLAALYSFAYNVGIDAFAKSVLLKNLNAGKKNEACSEMQRWVYADGKPWKGLMTRRKIEEELCQLNDMNEL